METIGAILRRYRQDAGMTIDAFEKITKMPAKYILSLESDAYHELPDSFYIKQHIKTYAKYLNLNAKKLLEVYEQSVGGVSSEAFHPQQPNETKEIITPDRIKFLVLVGLATLLIGYLGFAVNKIYRPPYLEVTTPVTNLIVADLFIEVRGVTESGAKVTINNRQIYTDSHGYFTATLDISPGINIVKIAAQKKHSRESVVFREILVQ